MISSTYILPISFWRFSQLAVYYHIENTSILMCQPQKLALFGAIFTLPQSQIINWRVSSIFALFHKKNFLFQSIINELFKFRTALIKGDGTHLTQNGSCLVFAVKGDSTKSISYNFRTVKKAVSRKEGYGKYCHFCHHLA